MFPIFTTYPTLTSPHYIIEQQPTQAHRDREQISLLTTKAHGSLKTITEWEQQVTHLRLSLCIYPILALYIRTIYYKHILEPLISTIQHFVVTPKINRTLFLTHPLIMNPPYA